MKESTDGRWSQEYCGCNGVDCYLCGAAPTGQTRVISHVRNTVTVGIPIEVLRAKYAYLMAQKDDTDGS